MKKRVLFGVVAALFVCALSGCSGASDGLTKIDDYFYEVGTYKTLDYDAANEYFATNNDNWGGGCSAISAVVDGTRLVGRNMDLNISNKCAYVIRTKVKGKYQTFGLAYTFRDISPDYADVQENGIDETFHAILPFMCDDVVNSEGLHIEINMRHGETDADGNDVFGVEHTNADAAERIYVFNLGQYIALNCKDVAAAKEYLANDIDVYSQKGYWNYCFVLTDAAGNSSLLEFGHNKYFWTDAEPDGVVAQANFYVNEECNKLEKVKTGLGRYETLMENIGGVTSKHELYELMKRVQYSSYYLPYDECKDNFFDPRSEVIGELKAATEEFIMDPRNEQFVRDLMDELWEPVRTMSRQEKQDMNELWESTFTEVVNPAEKTIEVRLFENEDNLYRITFKGVEKIDEI